VKKKRNNEDAIVCSKRRSISKQDNLYTVTENKQSH